MSQPDWSVGRHRHRPRHQDGQLGEGDRPVRQGPHRQHHRQEPQAVFYHYKWVFLTDQASIAWFISTRDFKCCEQNLKPVNNKESFKTHCVVSAINPCVEPASQKFKKDWNIQKLLFSKIQT